MKPIYFFFVYICLCNALLAQTKAEQALQLTEKQYPVEKVYLQYNKENFIAGEVLRFKSYVFSGYNLSTLSTNLYVELYNQQKELLDKLMVPLFKGVGENSITLNSKWPEGIYYIRAYTQWMLNFDEALPYLHTFAIYNPTSPQRLVPKPVQWTAQAFPESGQLLAGQENKIAVRLFSKGSLPESWRATVTAKNNPGAPVATFTAFNKEVGSFYLTPAENTVYQVHLTDASGNKQTIELPAAQKSGLLLQAKAVANEVQCHMYFKNIAAKPLNYKLVAQMQNEMVYKAVVKTSESHALAAIPIDQLTSGILHLTLFNEKEQPVAERLLFVDKGDVAATTLQYDTVSTAARSINHWRFAMDTAQAATYTAFVTDAAEALPKETLISTLLLSSDLSRPVHEAAAYFNPQHAERFDAMDALLLTEKWRWFKWENILNNVYPTIRYKPDNYLSYIGSVFTGKRLQLNKDINLLYRLEDSSVAVQQVKTDSSGAFYIDGALFRDTVRIYYQMNNKKQTATITNVVFEPVNTFKKLAAPLPAPAYTLVTRTATDSVPLALQRSLQAFQNQAKVDNRYRQLEEVIVRSRRIAAKDALNKKLSSPLFQSMDEQVFDFVHDNQYAFGFNNILEWLNGRVAGLQTRYVNGLPLPFLRNMPAAIYINEMLADIGMVSAIPVSDIAMVKVVRGFSGLGGNGAVLIYTRRGDTNPDDPFIGLPSTVITGYRKTVPLYAFDYKQDYFRNIERDTRELLYWAPQVAPDEKGAGHIRFFNNDITKQYRVTIIGINKNGYPVYTEILVPADIAKN